MCMMGQEAAKGTTIGMPEGSASMAANTAMGSKTVLANAVPALSDDTHDIFLDSALEVELAHEVELWRMDTTGLALRKAIGFSESGGGAGSVPRPPVFGSVSNVAVVTALTGQHAGGAAHSAQHGSGTTAPAHFLDGIALPPREATSTTSGAWDVPLEPTGSQQSSFTAQVPGASAHQMAPG